MYSFSTSSEDYDDGTEELELNLNLTKLKQIEENPVDKHLKGRTIPVGGLNGG